MSNDNTESISAKLRQIADMRMSSVTTDCTIATRFGIKCADVTCSECKRKVLRSIVDEIDAEKRAITERYARQSWMNPADAIAKLATGEIEWAELRQAINRYYLPRPLFEDGEPVWFGDRYVNDCGRPATLSSLNYTKGDHNYVSMNAGQRHKVTSRVKRDLPQALDADGVPIEIGDKVYLVPGEHCDRFPLQGYRSGVEYTVIDNRNPEHEANGRVCITRGDCLYGYPMPEQVTHREPDTQERIDMDAQESSHDYWKCYGYACSKCPAMFDGKIPSEHYGVSSCLEAQKLDLLRRQRELDGRDA